MDHMEWLGLGRYEGDPNCFFTNYSPDLIFQFCEILIDFELVSCNCGVEGAVWVFGGRSDLNPKEIELKWNHSNALLAYFIHKLLKEGICGSIAYNVAEHVFNVKHLCQSKYFYANYNKESKPNNYELVDKIFDEFSKLVSLGSCE